MVSGIRINVDGTFTSINYIPLEFLQRRMDRHIVNSGTGEYTLLDVYEYREKKYLIYGWLSGVIFNMFELSSCNPYGDLFVIGVNDDSYPIDIFLDEFLIATQTIDLDDDLLGDELELDDEDDYDYEDGFIVRDEDCSDEDSFGSIDYPDTPSNSDDDVIFI